MVAPLPHFLTLRQPHLWQSVQLRVAREDTGHAGELSYMLAVCELLVAHTGGHTILFGVLSVWLSACVLLGSNPATDAESLRRVRRCLFRRRAE